MKRLTTIFVTVALGLAAGGCYVADRPPVRVMSNGHALLGERWVRGGGQAVREGIGGLRHDGRFSSIMLVVANAPVEMYDVVVTFGNGEQFRPGTRMTFGPGGTSREIPLPGGARFIRRVDFVCANIPGDGRAKVELWAR